MKMMISKIKVYYKQILYLIVLGLCLSNTSTSLFAQDKDFELWNEISLKKEFNKNIGIVGGVQLRLDQNSSSIKSFFPEISLLYSINKYIRFNIDYRFSIVQKDNNSYTSKNRYNLGIRFRKKVKPFVFKYKVEYQYGLDNFLYREMFSTEKGNSYVRNKITIDYMLDKRWTPHISSEVFYHLQKPQSQFDIYRISFGIDYKFNKRNEITCSYLIEKEFNVYQAQSVYVLKINYTYKF